MRVIVNCRAGSVINREPAELVETLTNLLSEGGAEVEVACVDPDQLAAAVEQVLLAPVEVLVVGGGDGSIRTVASRLIGTDVTLGILPLGTTNRTARDLGIPLELEAAARALAAAETVRIDVAEVNGRIYLCNSMLGLPIALAEQRQEVRGQGVAAFLRGYGALFRDLMTTTRKVSVELEEGGTARRVRALMIAVANNAYDDTPKMVLARPALDRGELAVYLVQHEHGAAMAWAFVKAMLGLWRRDPEIEEIRTGQLTLRPHRQRVRVTNDGEVEELSTPLRYRSRPGALAVLKPRAAGA